MTKNQTEDFIDMIPEVMCNVPGRDCVEKNQTMEKYEYVYEIYLIYIYIIYI